MCINEIIALCIVNTQHTRARQSDCAEHEAHGPKPTREVPVLLKKKITQGLEILFGCTHPLHENIFCSLRLHGVLRTRN